MPFKARTTEEIHAMRSKPMCQAVVIDCPGIGQMNWCEQCGLYFGKDQSCPLPDGNEEKGK
jgi:hypothetical protein